MGLRVTLAEDHAARLVASIRQECLDHPVVFGEADLRCSGTGPAC